jgi:hypothetical protein
LIIDICGVDNNFLFLPIKICGVDKFLYINNRYLWGRQYFFIIIFFSS